KNRALLRQRHGLLSGGRTGADALSILSYLTRACELQMAAAQLAARSPIHTSAPHRSPHACEPRMGVEHDRPPGWQAGL
ncbi:class II aldolase/adducin family protein, partial [Klebsiella pneumoniae]|nr:class II aldolase/adducin family protein [Klebsiella pneumoniae]